MAYVNEASFVGRVLRIEDRDRTRIAEHRLGFFKADTMLLHIRRCFAFVPLKDQVHLGYTPALAPYGRSIPRREKQFMRAAYLGPVLTCGGTEVSAPSPCAHRAVAPARRSAG